ncbi:MULTISPECIES: NAD(P)H-dependent glycerol-3-phosphate dehydrogenase [unclassified Gilliamella]|uniref:NAD(P)H-dependent glycerol-3-phosphate dehydrogenase n=1 Tax=unclassified Gilliamella TaxID=2685620 RepID=UPI002269CF72|nr:MULTISPECIES: NAD(P)H-dependent glycerol-3-phosphate dehydrogenase [unclassified Gilliamella]MCX8602354.1 NAD(P)H-dependent glycerol-3-phosphate dehydrogenase [Gilliamella sp. B3722]MCX8608527.1 NAD(P)H-dependent glycerol-3-phosphate dehydrogenase [Gilliamella sp. B3771]MCX8610337.1 NAD(P)H-dependent glycerol-3-phosphate dehydrogenase [Gilliamella sp. B3891]MCX8612995.1 NAD(P)H-dependent glycerol-3-phosphate dehydrogenase [Gilliamella sp. B3773]MCX8616514.1 NAD(P)H-dependent glycerol-3-phos
MKKDAAVTVIGAGSYGTSLAILLARNGHRTLLWGHNPDKMAILQHDRQNNQFLPDIPFPDLLYIESDLGTAVAASPILLIVVPSHAFGNILKQIKPFLRKDSKIVWATKGLEVDTGRLLQDVAREILGDKIPLAVISGPTFAKEVASGLPTAVTVASTDDQFLTELQNLFHCSKSFRVYSSKDFIGVQLGGAIKNVIAIGAGLSDGLGFGANARTALITRGLAEMMRLGAALGADPATFMGMAGLGDLVLTCTDNQSRNRRFGILLGQNKTIKQAQDIIAQVVEGCKNTKEVWMLAQKYHVDMPITEQIYKILYEGKDPKQAAMTLLGRSQKQELQS